MRSRPDDAIYKGPCHRMGPSVKTQEVIQTLDQLMKNHGKPLSIRSDNGPEFTANALIQWLKDQQVGPLYIEPGSPWQNGKVESFHGKLRDECLHREWFASPWEARVLIAQWRLFYNQQRPHSALHY